MATDNLTVLFGTPLWSFKIEDYLNLNKQLIDSIIEEKKTDSGVNISNKGGWQSHGKLHMKSAFKSLVDIINTNLVSVGREYGFGEAAKQLKVTSMWANVNPAGSANAMHQHQSPVGMPNPLVISGCYYIKVPINSGVFIIKDLDRPMRYLQLPFQEANTINSYEIKIPPNEGDLLFFPAWMEHGVEENKSTEERVSIAFNVALINRPVPQQK